MAQNEEEKQKLREQRRRKMEYQRISCLGLIDIEGLTFEEAQELLRVKSEIRLEEIEDEKNKKVECYTIGKTFADRDEEIEFDRTDIYTWDLTGVSQRFTTTYKELNYDLIEVVCVVTEDSYPLPNDKTKKTESGKRSVWCKTDMYAVAFEQTLIHHFAFGRQDSRLSNKNLMSGKSPEDETKHAVGVVYIAVKLEKGEGRASKRQGNLENFEVSFDKDREGYAPNLIDLTNKSFKESEILLLEQFKSTVETLKIRRGPIKTFSIGISFANKLSKGDLNVSDFKTWKVQQGVSSSYKYLSKHGYHLDILLCGIKKKTIKSDNAKNEELHHYDITEKLTERLVEHVKNDKAYRDFCTKVQKELEGLIDKRASCFVIFVALEFDKRRPEEAAANSARPPSDAEIKEVPEAVRLTRPLRWAPTDGPQPYHLPPKLRRTGLEEGRKDLKKPPAGEQK